MALFVVIAGCVLLGLESNWMIGLGSALLCFFLQIHAITITNNQVTLAKWLSDYDYERWAKDQHRQ